MKLSQLEHSGLLAQSRKIYHSIYFAPCIVFLAMLFITYLSWRASIVTLNRDRETVMADRSTQTQNELVQKLSTYEQILTGGAGLVRGSQDVKKSEWHDYVSTFDTTNRYPGLQGIGYVRAFSAAELPDVVAKMQEQDIDFHITPDTPRDFYTAILYADPERTVNPVGIDMYTEPNRMKIMAAARDSGHTRITPPLKSLLPDTTEPVIYMYVPQYRSGSSVNTVSERQQSLQGYVYARLIGMDFFDALISSDNTNRVVFKLDAYDNNNSWQTVYKSPVFDQNKSSPMYTGKEQTINVYGQTWKFTYSFKTNDLLPPQRRNTPAWTILAGVLLAFLLSELVYLLLKARANELSNQQEKAVDLAKDELLSLASHQLRTPATTVKQYLGMVLQGFAGDITPTQANLLNKAYAGNERQLYIINEMLHVAKIDSGRIVLARHETDINQMLKDVVQETETEREASDHKLSLRLPKKAVVLEIDEHMLRMSIENLVNNAIKYTLPSGKIKVTLRRNKGMVKIAVQDSGIGIDPKDIGKLYKLFTRLDNPLTQNISGTGIGLYLAKHLIELHGGTLTVTSKPNVGSTFTITLPVTIKE